MVRPRAGLRLPGLTFLVTLAVLTVAMTALPRLYRLAARQPPTVDRLLSAAGIGDFAGVRAALDDGVQPDANTNGITALAVTSDPAIAQLLLARGAKLDGISDRGTPLLQAIATERLAVARVLLEAGADPNQRMPADSLSPLEAARQRSNELTIALLLKYGAVDAAQPPPSDHETKQPAQLQAARAEDD